MPFLIDKYTTERLNKSPSGLALNKRRDFPKAEEQKK